jgi:hypothetical protein
MAFKSDGSHNDISERPNQGSRLPADVIRRTARQFPLASSIRLGHPSASHPDTPVTPRLSEQEFI